MADVIAATPKGYARYPKIASQIPSPLAGSYRCRLKGEALVGSAVRSFGPKGAAGPCELKGVEAIELLSERPLAFAGAALCRMPSSSFWKKGGEGVGLDVVVEDGRGGFTYEFVPFHFSEGAASGVKIAQLSKRYGGGLFVSASFGESHQGGICRRHDEGWRCMRSELKGLSGPVAFAGYPGDKEGGPLLVLSSDGAAFEVALGPKGDEIKLLPAGGVEPGSDGKVVGAIRFPAQSDRPPTLVLGREQGLSVAAVLSSRLAQPVGAEAGSGVLRAVPGERFAPESAVDDVFPGDRFAFGRPHAMAVLPLKGFGGRDLFVAYRIMSGQRQIGEMGFFYMNANDRPSGQLSEISFDGRRGSANLSFTDPAGDGLSYRAKIRARHGGSLDDWVDGFEGGKLRFSVKGDPAALGVWPIEITVEATDPGGLSSISRAVVRRDGTVEAISESTGHR